MLMPRYAKESEQRYHQRNKHNNMIYGRRKKVDIPGTLQIH